MTRRTYGIHTAFAATTVGGLVLIGMFAAAGCTQEERRTTARSAAQAAVASATTTAGGQSATTTTTPTPRRAPGVKPNGKGGFDASVAQKNALTRAHWMRDHHNEAFKPFRPSTQPTSQPTTAAR